MKNTRHQGGPRPDQRPHKKPTHHSAGGHTGTQPPKPALRATLSLPEAPVSLEDQTRHGVHVRRLLPRPRAATARTATEGSGPRPNPPSRGVRERPPLQGKPRALAPRGVSPRKPLLPPESPPDTQLTSVKLLAFGVNVFHIENILEQDARHRERVTRTVGTRNARPRLGISPPSCAEKRVAAIEEKKKKQRLRSAGKAAAGRMRTSAQYNDHFRRLLSRGF